jgi:hypothetical protein
MPSRNGNTLKKRTKPGLVIRWLITFLKFLMSPLVILADSFRSKGVIDKIWIFSFFLFTTVMMILTGFGIMVTEDPLFKTLKMMSVITDNNEILAGDLQPMIRIINKYALQYKVDPNLVFAIIKTESDFDPRAVSRSGARGLMQIMPEVWREYSHSSCLGRHSNQIICKAGENCIYTPEANIRAGTRYFHSLLVKYGDRVDLALEAYNAGISNVKPGDDPKYQETRSYVDNIVAFWKEVRKDTIDRQLKLSMRLQQGLKWLFCITFACWLILFWWASRKLFLK